MLSRTIRGGVTAPKGFTASGLYSGIKRSRKKDLALVYSEKICNAAGVFTTNKVQASCVAINRRNLAKGKAQALIANSGNANCMTGKRGFKDSEKIISQLSRSLKVPQKYILIASTGVIGKPLPIRNISSAIPTLVKKLSRNGGRDAAEGIMTTDHKIKEIAAEIIITGKSASAKGGPASGGKVNRESASGRKVRIGAIAKGAGMIHPKMSAKGGSASGGRGVGAARHATMLCFVTTDAVISSAVLQRALHESVERTFNMITVDGDTSTNDMVLTLANGMAGNKIISADSKEFRLFQNTLEKLFLTLAKLMVKDAEGATKFVEIEVRGARSAEDARKAAMSIANSNLFKCAVYGSDPNWGRIAAAAGYSGAEVDQWKMKISLGNELVLQNGSPLTDKTARLERIFAKKEIKVTVELGLGKAGATAYTCDFSPEYVKINSAYRT